MLFVILFMLRLVVGSAHTITVKQDGTGDFSAVQPAIDASANGDTVLVWPGTYYENIIFNGHSITLASLNLITGNPDYVHQTVIDGNYEGTCIMVNLQENVTVQGFTIQHGKSTDQPCFISGGGVFLGDGLNFHSMDLINCIIQNNYAELHGGGVHVVCSSLYLSGVIVKNNLAFYVGGGISVVGGDCPLIFDTVNLCSVFNNYAPRGCDLVKAINTPIFKIPLDTFSVSLPDYYNVHLLNYDPFQLNDYLSFQHYYTESANADLYVNPLGNNTNSGLTPDDPLKNIAFAMSKIVSDSLCPNAIYLANGVYSKNGTEEKFPFGCKSHVSIIGESKDSTILDASGFSMHIYCGRIRQKTYNINIKHLALVNGFGENGTSSIGSSFFGNTENLYFEDLSFRNNIALASSNLHFSLCKNVNFERVSITENIGGIPLRIFTGYRTDEYPRIADSVFISNCIFEHNAPNADSAIGYGGALSVHGIPYGDSIIVTVTNSLFHHNTNDCAGYTGCIVSSSDYGTIHFANCTFVHDSAFNSEYSSNLGVGGRAKLYLYNSITYHNYPWEIYVYPYMSSPAELYVYNSLVEGGLSGIACFNWGMNHIHYDSTNIDADPLFYGGAEFPFNLSAESPCIDAGTLDLPAFIRLPATDLAGNPRVFNGKIDMGAYEWNPTVDVKLHKPFQQPKNITAAPNPFSSQTYITAHWNKTAKITIDVYNNTGLRIKRLQNGTEPPGSCRIPWDGTNNNGHCLPAGVYYVLLTVDGKEVESVKIVKK